MKTLGLVLGSGGARGLAHIGVIRALEAADIKIHYLAGASIGALIGAMYVADELDDFETFAYQLDWKTTLSYFDVVFPRTGLLDGGRVQELLSTHLQQLSIETAKIKFCCVATDLVSGQEVRLQRGPMVDAVRASIAIPGIFTPFQRGAQYLGDGGIVNPVPVDVMHEMGADVIVAVNLNSPAAAATLPLALPLENNARFEVEVETSPVPKKQLIPNERVNVLLKKIQQNYEVVQEQLQGKIENWLLEDKQEMNIFDVIGTALNVMEQQVTQSKLQVCPPDLLLEPALSEYGIFDFHQAEQLVIKGYQVMQHQMPTLKRLLA